MAECGVLEADSYSEAVDEPEQCQFDVGCDEYPDFVCYPCGKSGKTVAATKFCIDCAYLMCSTCHAHHNKFDMMKGHRVTTAEASTEYQSQDRALEPTIRCHKHNGKLIDTYCITHETPGCVNCISIEHSSCARKEYIPKIAKGIKTRDEYKMAVTLCEKKLDALNKSKRGKEHCLGLLEAMTVETLETLTAKREAIDLVVGTKQKSMVDGIQGRSNKKTSEIRDEISELTANITRIKDNKTKLERHELNDSDTFIVLKTTKVEEDDAMTNIELGNAMTSVTVCYNPQDWTVFQGLNLFGQISETIEAEFEKDCPIKSAVDKRVSCITDTCLLDDGKLILADQDNRVIKKLSATFQLEDTLKIPGKPGSICQTKYPEVAISLLSNKTIQFATVSSPMSLTKSISIEEACRGIAFANSALYLSCGGMRQYGDGPGEIRVYDQDDELCRKYTKVCGKGMSIPKRITATSSDVFFPDSDNGVFGLGVHGGGEKGPFTHKDMVSPIGICGLTHEVLIVCGYESHNVMLLDVQDGSMKTLIGKDQGLKKPKSVCVDSTGKKLLVSMSNADIVKVYDLIKK